MSIAIAPTFEANKIGVRRVYTLAGIGLGTAPDPDTINELVANGYDPGDVQSAVALGATDEQLLALPYPADPVTEANAIQGLIIQLTIPGVSSTPTMTTSPVGTAYGAVSSAASAVISVAGQTFDLTQEAAWNSLASLILSWQQAVQLAASQNPGDATIAANVQQFNSGVAQFASYYQQAMSEASSPQSVIAIPQVTLSGLGIIPIAVVGIVAAAVAAIVIGLYAIYQYALTRRTAQAAAAQVQTTAVTGAQAAANTLLAQANTLSTSNPTQAAALRAQAAALLGQTVSSTAPAPAAGSTLATWFTQNWVYVGLFLVGIPVFNQLAKKI